MEWYVYVGIGIVASALATVFRRISLKDETRIGVYESSLILSITTLLSIAIYLLVTQSFVMPPLGDIAWVVAANIVLGLVAWLASQKALSEIASAEYTVAMTIRVLVTWLLSVALLQIGTTFWQGVGAIVIVAAIFVVFYRRKDVKRRGREGMMYALLTGVIYGGSMITDQLIYRVSDPPSFMLIGFLISTALLIIIRPRSVKALAVIARDKKAALVFLIAGVMMAVDTAFVFIGLKLADNATLVTALLQTQVILVAIFGALLIKAERKHFVRLIIGTAMAAGAAYLILG